LGCVGLLGIDRLSVWSRNRLGIKTSLRRCEWASTDLVGPRLRCRSDAVCRSALMYRSKIVYGDLSHRRVDASRWRHLIRTTARSELRSIEEIPPEWSTPRSGTPRSR